MTLLTDEGPFGNFVFWRNKREDIISICPNLPWKIDVILMEYIYSLLIFLYYSYSYVVLEHLLKIYNYVFYVYTFWMKLYLKHNSI